MAISQRRFSLNTRFLIWVAGFGLITASVPAAEEYHSGLAVVLELEGIIGPASSDFVVRGIEAAEISGAVVVILRMNTPGGLDTSMRDIIHKILSSRVPVVSYVAPPGSRAASAGTYITKNKPKAGATDFG